LDQTAHSVHLLVNSALPLPLLSQELALLHLRSSRQLVKGGRRLSGGPCSKVLRDDTATDSPLPIVVLFFRRRSQPIVVLPPYTTPAFCVLLHVSHDPPPQPCLCTITLPDEKGESRVRGSRPVFWHRKRPMVWASHIQFLIPVYILYHKTAFDFKSEVPLMSSLRSSSQRG